MKSKRQKRVTYYPEIILMVKVVMEHGEDLAESCSTWKDLGSAIVRKMRKMPRYYKTVKNWPSVVEGQRKYREKGGKGQLIDNQLVLDPRLIRMLYEEFCPNAALPGITIRSTELPRDAESMAEQIKGRLEPDERKKLVQLLNDDDE